MTCQRKADVSFSLADGAGNNLCLKFIDAEANGVHKRFIESEVRYGGMCSGPRICPNSQMKAPLIRSFLAGGRVVRLIAETSDDMIMRPNRARERMKRKHRSGALQYFRREGSP